MALRELVQQMSSGSTDTQEAGLAAFVQWVYQDPIERGKQAARGGALKPLFHLVQHGSTPYIRFLATQAICPSADDLENRDAIKAENGVAILNDVLSTGTPEAKSCAAGILWNVALQSKDVCVYLIEHGAMQNLIDLAMTTTNPDSQMSATGCLASIIFEAPDLAFETNVLLPNLIKLLRTGIEPFNRSGAADAIGSMATGHKASKAILAHLDDFMHIYNRESDFDMQRSLIRVFSNLSTVLDSTDKTRMRDANVVNLVKPWLEKGYDAVDPGTHVTATMCIANLVGHIENHELLRASDVIIHDIMDMFTCTLAGKLYANRTWAIWAPLQAFANISVNEANKERLINCGVLDPVMQVLRERKDARAVEYGTKLVSNLSFKYNLAAKVDDIEVTLKEIAADKSNKAAVEYANLCLFQLKQKVVGQKAAAAAASTPAKAASAARGKHIMLSYPWKYQELFLWLRDFFRKQGFTVWMDVDHMNASILESMASAVEDAAVVIFCLSSAYKESEACRTEGEYAYRLHKQLVPVLAESGYQADGWLGALVGNKLYFDFASNSYDSMGPKLLAELEKQGVTPESLSGGTSGGGSADTAASALRVAQRRADEAETELKRLQAQVHQSKGSDSAGASAAPSAVAGANQDQLRAYCDQRFADLTARISRLEDQLQRVSANGGGNSSFCSIL